LTSVSSTTSPILDVTGPVTEDNSGRLLLGKVQLLIRHSPVGILLSLLVALLNATLIREVADHDKLLLWVGSIIVVTVIRLTIVAAYRYSGPTGAEAGRWVWRLCLGNLLSGIVWGSSILLLDPNWPVPQQVAMVLALAGITAGAISAYAVIYTAFLSIHLPTLIPAIVWFAMQADPVYQLLSVILAIYMLGLLAIGHTHYRSIQLALQLAMDNEQLVRQLTEANSNLKSEVCQKQHAMDELGQEKERAQVTLHSIGDGVITTDRANRVLSMNAVAEQLTGWTTDEARGRPVAQVFQVEESNKDRHAAKEHRSHGSGRLQDALERDVSWKREKRAINGAIINLEQIVSYFNQEGKDKLQGICDSFTAVKREIELNPEKGEGRRGRLIRSVESLRRNFERNFKLSQVQQWMD